MLRHILILLGETPASTSARRYAFRLAQSTKAAVTGLAGVDLSYIETPMPGRIGAAAYKFRLEEQLKKQADDIRNRVQQVFELECTHLDVPHDLLSFEGDPIEALYQATGTCDLVIAGHDTAFRGNIHEQLSEVLAKILLATPRPMIVCPDELTSANEVMIAYDGSVPSMRAVQMFVLLGVEQSQPIHVTAIDPNRELAARKTDIAVRYLGTHGYQVHANPIASRIHPAELLKVEIAKRKVGTLIMGAYGHRGFREYLFGSTTSTLVESPPCALFIYH